MLARLQKNIILLWDQLHHCLYQLLCFSTMKKICLKQMFPSKNYCGHREALLELYFIMVLQHTDYIIAICLLFHHRTRSYDSRLQHATQDERESAYNTGFSTPQPRRVLELIRVIEVIDCVQ